MGGCYPSCYLSDGCWGRASCATVIIQLSQQILPPAAGRQRFSLSDPKYLCWAAREPGSWSTVWLFTLPISMLGIKQTTQCTRAGCFPFGLGPGKLFHSTLIFLLFHPSQEGLLVLLPGLTLALVLLWSECPPLRAVLSLLRRMHVEIVRLLFYGQEGRVCGQVHLTRQVSAWKEPGITFPGSQGRFRSQL